jgi:hypothetical protein
MKFKKSDRIILVGNGPSTLKRKKGPVINNHEIIIRLNDWVTDGFEQHVGSKTTHWFVGPSKWSRIKGRDISKLKGFCMLPYKHYKSESFIREHLRKCLELDPDDFDFLDKEDSRKMTEIATNFGCDLIPSSGLNAILYLTCILRLPITIIGFDCYQDKDDFTHYYGDNNRDLTFNLHNWKIEKDIITALNKLNFIRIL